MRRLALVHYAFRPTFHPRHDFVEHISIKATNLFITSAALLNLPRKVLEQLHCSTSINRLFNQSNEFIS
jgi:hypothetical protein